jgi:DNA-binding CsgD family transcriptional regulator
MTSAALRTGKLTDAVRLARQVQMIRAGSIPGWTARMSSNVLTPVLIDSGDLAAAERSCTAGLARARDAGDLLHQAALLPYMMTLDLRAGRLDDAAVHLRELLQIATRTGGIDVFNGLECCGYLCAATGRAAEAVTVWATYTALLRQAGLPDLPKEARRRAAPLQQARRALGTARARAAEDRGAAMSMTAATEYALLLTAPERPLPDASQELGKLSARERELVSLVAQGRTNAQIAAQLHISVNTVGSHLDRIRDKTGCRRRADLTRLARAAGLV